MQEANRPLCTRLVRLANATRIAKFSDLVAHLGPPVPMADIICCFLGTEVSQNGVSLVNDYSRQAIIFCDFAGDTQDFLCSSVSRIYEPVSY